jgi:phytoene dehydrogenase-like protein
MTVDAVVVGAGPNGLAAAITLARAGRSVRVLEAASTPGGGLRTAELTEPGYLHDVCSAIHPLAAASPFFRTVDLAGHGVELVHPAVPLAHPLDRGRAAVLDRSIDRTAEALGPDARRWRQLVGWPAEHWDRWAPGMLGPFLRLPRHPLALGRFGGPGLLPASAAVRAFGGDEARALFAGLAAHSFLPLSHPLTTALGVVLGAAAHYAGWPLVAGGSQRLSDALVAELASLGVEVVCNHPVRSLAPLAEARAVLFDVSPRQLVAIAGSELSERDQARYRRHRPGPGVFKLDHVLSEPVPWTNPSCLGAGTVHLGGRYEEVARSEADVNAGRHAEQPFVLVAQPSLFDPSRVAGNPGHTLWSYCHVPNGSTMDMTERIEAQIERFAPGFRDTIVARHAAGPAWFEDHNENYVGGDISGGSPRGVGLVLRPGWRLHPYRTSNPRLFLCSASTPPGPAVHGMCGYHAARDALATALR